jgi:hypothetical protein
MNFYKQPFHHNNSTSTNTPPTSLRDPITVPSSSPSVSQTNGSVRFNDLISAQPKFNEREKYLTA